MEPAVVIFILIVIALAGVFFFLNEKLNKDTDDEPANDEIASPASPPSTVTIPKTISKPSPRQNLELIRQYLQSNEHHLVEIKWLLRVMGLMILFIGMGLLPSCV